MATFTNTYNFDVSNTANFQALMGAIDAQILATCGWSLTADTGQTDPASASAPAANSNAGYRIYKTNDGLTDYYLKINYGRGGSNNARFVVDIGSGTNGSGTVTGQTGTQLTLTCGLGSGTQRLYLAGDTGRLMFALAVNTGTTSDVAALIVGRTCDATGAFDSTGIEIWAAAGSNSPKAQYVPFSGTVGTQETAWPCAFSTRAPLTNGSATFVGIPVLFAEGGVTHPSRHVAVWDGNAASFTNNTSTSFTLYGATRTYLVNQQANIVMGSGQTRSMFFYE